MGDDREADYDGPRRFGMRAMLIDPDRRHDVPADERLTSVQELADRLG